MPPIVELIKNHFNPQDDVEDYAEFLFKEILNQKSCDELEKNLLIWKKNIEAKKIDREVLKDNIWKYCNRASGFNAYCNIIFFVL